MARSTLACSSGGRTKRPFQGVCSCSGLAGGFFSPAVAVGRTTIAKRRHTPGMRWDMVSSRGEGPDVAQPSLNRPAASVLDKHNLTDRTKRRSKLARKAGFGNKNAEIVLLAFCRGEALHYETFPEGRRIVGPGPAEGVSAPRDRPGCVCLRRSSG